MSEAGKQIRAWVSQKPIIVLRLTEEESDSIWDTHNQFERFTINRPHGSFEPLRCPTICLLERYRHDHGSEWCLGVATSKATSGTLDTRVVFQRILPIYPKTPLTVVKESENAELKRFIRSKITLALNSGQPQYFTSLKSGQFIEQLDKYIQNGAAFLALLPLKREKGELHSNAWATEDSLKTTLKIFGLQHTRPDFFWSADEQDYGLTLTAETRLYEDMVINYDATEVLGYDRIEATLTGKAVFRKGSEKLSVYIANRLPLEDMLGVDLIYFNEKHGNVVLIQYKMFEETPSGEDWVFRPSEQFEEQIKKMLLPFESISTTSYRLNEDPFYFKFVKRKIIGKVAPGIILSLGHTNHVRNSSRGIRGGVRISYNDLDGVYLRQEDLICLIRSGLIGTHREHSEILVPLIEAVSHGDRRLVLAWHRLVNEARQ